MESNTSSIWIYLLVYTLVGITSFFIMFSHTKALGLVWQQNIEELWEKHCKDNAKERVFKLQQKVL